MIENYQQLVQIFFVAQTRVDLCFRLLGATVIFFLVGEALNLSRKKNAWGLIYSQIFVVFYFLLRNALMHFLKITPTSFVDFYIVMGSLALMGLWKLRISSWKYLLGNLSALVFIFFGIMGVASFADWPLVLYRSGDVTAYALQTKLFLEFFHVPWSLEPLGPGHFYYPAGFAVLNGSWSLLSGLSALEITPLQISLQFVVLLWSLVNICLISSYQNQTFLRLRDYLIFAFVSVWFFWALPSFFRSIPNQAGLARNCGAPFLLYGLYLYFSPLKKCNFILIALIVSLTAINPANGILLFLLSATKFRRFLNFQGIGMAFLGWIALFGGDPYYHDILFKNKITTLTNPSGAVDSASQGWSVFLATPKEYLIDFLKGISKIFDFTFQNNVNAPLTTFLFVLFCYFLSGGRTKFLKWVIPSVLIVIFSMAFINPNVVLLPGTLRFRVFEQLGTVVWLSQMSAALMCFLVLFYAYENLLFLRFRKIVFIVWFLTLPSLANIKLVSARRNWLPEGWDSVDNKFLNDLNVYKKLNAQDSARVLFPPTTSIFLGNNGEIGVGPKAPYQVYAFLPKTYVAFLCNMGNSKYTGYQFNQLGFDKHVEAKLTWSFDAFTQEQKKWVTDHHLMIWPPVTK